MTRSRNELMVDRLRGSSAVVSVDGLIMASALAHQGARLGLVFLEMRRTAESLAGVVGR